MDIPPCVRTGMFAMSPRPVCIDVVIIDESEQGPSNPDGGERARL